MVKDEVKELPAKPAAVKSTKKLEISKPELPPVPTSETALESEETEEPKTLPKIRLRVEEEAGKVKQFATAQGLSMHIKVNKAKRAGLSALHKMATWLTPKKK
jgi:hypothetical protein